MSHSAYRPALTRPDALATSQIRRQLACRCAASQAVGSDDPIAEGFSAAPVESVALDQLLTDGSRRSRNAPVPPSAPGRLLFATLGASRRLPAGGGCAVTHGRRVRGTRCGWRDAEDFPGTLLPPNAHSVCLPHVAGLTAALSRAAVGPPVDGPAAIRDAGPAFAKATAREPRRGAGPRAAGAASHTGGVCVALAADGGTQKTSPERSCHRTPIQCVCRTPVGALRPSIRSGWMTD